MKVQNKEDLKLSSTSPFYGKWDPLVETLAQAFNLSDKEKSQLKNRKFLITVQQMIKIKCAV